MSKITVVLADDHKMIRDGLKKILNSTADIEVIGEVTSGLEVIDMVEELSPDLLILDISMPDKSGLDILKDLQNISLSKSPKVLVLSMHPEDKFALRTLKAGAHGYLTKESASDELIKAAREIGNGGRYISPTVTEKITMQFVSNSEVDPLDSLSDREFQILQFIASGKLQQEIANELHISPSTVNTYRSRILEKLKLNSTADMIRFAMENDIIKK